ncbi:MAG TPA: type II toxin-antitoxin system RelE/ParE family toxin [Candidatus Nanoarchaeia archaeon]|nr:type II toxin-antitoxin system RelE/ParE family toxin [Candidatus Nanoarchaeia archaeon]
MYEIVFSETAKGQFGKLEKNIQERIISVLERIRVRPESYVRKLVNEECYRLRIGDYRVILDIDKGKLIILVVKTGHRSTIYQ